jgi:hypothetical protein
VTEGQWLAETYPPAMVKFLGGAASDRKLRLYACACARRTWGESPDARSRAAVETAERFADGRATTDELAAAYRPARQVSLEWAQGHPNDPGQFVLIAPADAAAPAAFGAADTASVDAGWPIGGEDIDLGSVTNVGLADLARCVFGNPFRPVVFDSRWRTDDSLGLARAIYEDRAFDRLPLLADALMDAGCADEQVLAHCRSDGPHARGCWVVDLVLGKE